MRGAHSLGPERPGRAGGLQPGYRKARREKILPTNATLFRNPLRRAQGFRFPLPLPLKFRGSVAQPLSQATLVGELSVEGNVLTA